MMGINIQRIVDNDRPDLHMNKQRTLERGWVWVVLRRDPKSARVINIDSDNLGHDWHIQGIMTDEALALGICLDENYIIGPLPIDTALPEKRIEWAGSYFPLAKTDPIEG
jgi:hypothetical protein